MFVKEGVGIWSYLLSKTMAKKWFVPVLVLVPVPVSVPIYVPVPVPVPVPVLAPQFALYSLVGMR